MLKHLQFGVFVLVLAYTSRMETNQILGKFTLNTFGKNSKVKKKKINHRGWPRGQSSLLISENIDLIYLV